MKKTTARMTMMKRTAGLILLPGGAGVGVGEVWDCKFGMESLRRDAKWRDWWRGRERSQGALRDLQGESTISFFDFDPTTRHFKDKDAYQFSSFLHATILQPWGRDFSITITEELFYKEINKMKESFLHSNSYKRRFTSQKHNMKAK